MVTRPSGDKTTQHSAKAALYKQAGDLVTQECRKYVESTRLAIEANRLCIQAHRIRREARDVQREIGSTKMVFPASPDLEALEEQRQTLCQTADELQAQAVQLLTEAMRLRAHLMIPHK